jgi:hypothetical protein
MEYNFFKDLENKVFSTYSSVFEPSVNIFENGIVINYQKVGTRFLQLISSGDKFLSNTNNKQIQFIFLNISTIGSFELNPINYEFSKKFVSSPWTNESKNFLLEGYPLGISDESFLQTQGYKNYTDFFFNNNKDFYFIIRNPIHRFFSGVIQILNVDVEEITIENFGNLLRENFHYIMSDIHTINYLNHYREMIYNIKDKSKIKIIDLSHLKSKNSYDFFCKLRGDDVIKPIYDNIDEFVDSNRETYEKLYELYKEVDPDFSISIQYIKEEYSVYQELKNSQYFLDLS